MYANGYSNAWSIWKNGMKLNMGKTKSNGGERDENVTEYKIMIGGERQELMKNLWNLGSLLRRERVNIWNYMYVWTCIWKLY